MVSDLQKTLQQKNNAMNKLANKSKGLSKAMQPRMAYKYASRDQHSSSSDVLNSNAGSTSPYVFSGRKPSNLDKQQALNLYQRRAKSIVMQNDNGVGINKPAAGPSSGDGFMFNDASATKFKSQPRDEQNEVVVVATGIDSQLANKKENITSQ